MRKLIQDLHAEDQRTKTTKNEPPSRNRSKIVSDKKGDNLKRRKTKVSSDEEGTSNEEIRRTMKRGEQLFPRRNRECPGDATSAVLSSSKHGSLNIKVLCPIGLID
jgi:hypothetical protein